ncbi:hypothetical protein B0H67DRAFT_560963 [Lasiosphaeris hirsuta]|uniref:Uncharacterized protein n=1 Tax=Lasiosphaeris hirsuta TaxID=260670 RepID=A0AA40B9M1_9PEZI|nr:hypothetical protein B0H67DRAFT_560963 [Lasiosphaeris hirsuta]
MTAFGCTGGVQPSSLAAISRRAVAATLAATILSSPLPSVGMRVMGLRDLVRLGSLPGFASRTTSAVRHLCG